MCKTYFMFHAFLSYIGSRHTLFHLIAHWNDENYVNWLWNTGRTWNNRDSFPRAKTKCMTITIITASFSTFSGVLNFWYNIFMNMNMNDSTKEERHSKFTVVVSLLMPLIEQMLLNVRINHTYTHIPLDFMFVYGMQIVEKRKDWLLNTHQHTQRDNKEFVVLFG